MGRRVARLAALAALVAGIGVGLYTYYGPTGMMCSVRYEVIGGGQTQTAPPPQEECRSTSLAENDTAAGAFAFLSVWSLAPGLAVAGSYGPKKLAVALASVAFAMEFVTFLAAMSVGFLYFLIVMPLTGIALIAAIARDNPRT